MPDEPESGDGADGPDGGADDGGDVEPADSGGSATPDDSTDGSSTDVTADDGDPPDDGSDEVTDESDAAGESDPDGDGDGDEPHGRGLMPAHERKAADIAGGGGANRADDAGGGDDPGDTDDPDDGDSDDSLAYPHDDFSYGQGGSDGGNGTDADGADSNSDAGSGDDDPGSGGDDDRSTGNSRTAGYDPADDDVVATDGEGATVDAGSPAVEDDYEDYDPDYVDDGIVGDGPEGDVEMPLTEHIEEMIRRLAVVFFLGGLVTLFLYPGADVVNAYFATDLPTATNVINHLWDKHIPGTATNPERRPRLYGPLELVLTELKVAGLGGLVFGLPALVYESYLFMRPGLYQKERRYYLAAVPTSVVLAAIGVAFAHFAVLPAIFAYFTSYTTGTAVVAFGLRETFNLILILMGYMAIVFQIPLFIMLAIMMDLVTSQWLRERRLLFWGAFLGISFIATPDPTGMAPIIVGATMIVLFEGTLGVLKYTRH